MFRDTWNSSGTQEMEGGQGGFERPVIQACPAMLNGSMSDPEATSPCSHTVSVSLSELLINEDREAKCIMNAKPSVSQR